MLSVEVNHLRVPYDARIAVQAAHIDRIGFRRRARAAERMDAAVPAKMMLRPLGTELVKPKCVRAGKQREIFGVDAM